MNNPMHLRSFKVNLFLEIHILLATRETFERETKLFNDESVENTSVSSAYMTNFTSLVALIISFIYRMNKIGVKIPL